MKSKIFIFLITFVSATVFNNNVGSLYSKKPVPTVVNQKKTNQLSLEKSSKNTTNKRKQSTKINDKQNQHVKVNDFKKKSESIIYKNAKIYLKSSSFFSYSISYKTAKKNSDGSFELISENQTVNMNSKGAFINASFFQIGNLIMQVGMSGQKKTKFTFTNTSVLQKMIKNSFKNNASPLFNLSVGGVITAPKAIMNCTDSLSKSNTKIGEFQIESAAAWWAAHSIIMNFIITVLCIAFLALGGPTISLFVLRGVTMPDGGSITSVEDAIKTDPVTNNPEVTDEENQYAAPSEGSGSNSPYISGENSSEIQNQPGETHGTVVNHTIERGGPATQFLTTAGNPFANPDINDSYQGTDEVDGVSSNNNQSEEGLHSHLSSGQQSKDVSQKTGESKASSGDSGRRSLAKNTWSDSDEVVDDTSPQASIFYDPKRVNWITGKQIVEETDRVVANDVQHVPSTNHPGLTPSQIKETLMEFSDADYSDDESLSVFSDNEDGNDKVIMDGASFSFLDETITSADTDSTKGIIATDLNEHGSSYEVSKAAIDRAEAIINSGTTRVKEWVANIDVKNLEANDDEEQEFQFNLEQRMAGIEPGEGDTIFKELPTTESRELAERNAAAKRRAGWRKDAPGKILISKYPKLLETYERGSATDTDFAWK